MRVFHADCWGNLCDHIGVIGTSDKSGVHYAVGILNKQQAEINKRDKAIESYISEIGRLNREIGTRDAEIERLTQRDDVWKAKKELLETDLAKAWEEIERLKTDALRYDKLRKMKPYQWLSIYHENINTGKPFDELVDVFKEVT